MNTHTLFFFHDHADALPLYEKLEGLILEQIRNVTITVSKTQISFSNKRGFAFVSFAPVRKAKDRPKTYITVTFGLSYQKLSSRIDAAAKPYPNRWTHHVMVSRLEEIDDELMSWIREAAEFSANKR